MPLKTDLDFWGALEAGIACCVPVNCIVKRGHELVMGAGLAKAVAGRFPALPMIFGMAFEAYGADVYQVVCSDLEAVPRALISFPTKRHFKDPSDPELIRWSARRLAEVIEPGSRVYLPKVGCGLGGLDWGRVVAPILEATLDERFLIPHEGAQ